MGRAAVEEVDVRRPDLALVELSLEGEVSGRHALPRMRGNDSSAKRRPEGAHVSVTGGPLKGPDGVTNRAVIVFRDITNFKRAEEELQQNILRQRDQTRLMETVSERHTQYTVFGT